MKANNVTVLNWEIAEENETVSDLMKELEITDILQLFEGDPDIININGEKVLFISVANDSVVIYVDPSYTADTDEVERMLSDFFADKNIESIESTWDNFADHTIAYRCGCGYSYNLYKYTA